ncbi:hypothetical protein ACMD2_12454 [Ananas comosus]|uniref:Uncharacterized protein n=1 Tax=Ananas comosus TaxID=4615 RepID=A0A199UFW4_ANACO|nr:hypothetical protein ACMD2_12454 [Ananas comosus]
MYKGKSLVIQSNRRIIASTEAQYSMGLLSRWKVKGDARTSAAAAKPVSSASAAEEVPVAMNGAVEARQRESDPTVFEFGPLAVAPGDEFTLAGYCTMSDRLEPCRWAIVSATATTAAAHAPRFRITF